MRLTAGILLTSSLLAMPLGLAGQEVRDSREERAFRLDGPELHEMHRRASNLVAADLNGDGRLDLAAISNDEGVLRLLLGKEAKAGEGGFEASEITLDRIVTSMAAVDVNGDGRTDLVLAGSPASLSIMYQNEDGRLQKGETKDIDAERLVLGDLTNDGRDDLLLLNGTRFQILASRARDISLEPTKTFHASEALSGPPRIADLNGDGRNDLLYSPASSNETLVVRLQSPEGDFPSEVFVRTGQLRTFQPLEVRGGAMVAAINGRTRQLTLLELQEPVLPRDNSLIPGAPQVIGLDPDTHADNPIPVVADFDGDGREDIAIAVPSLPSLRLLQQTRTGGLIPRHLPTLEDVRHATAWPAKAGEAAPLLILSGKEKTLAVAKAAPDTPGLLRFPEPVALEAEPLAFATARLGKAGLVLVGAERQGDERRLVAYPGFNPGEASAPKAERLFDLAAIRKDPPQSVEAVDFNGDGVDELVVLFEFDKPLLLQQKAGKWESVDTTGVLGGLLEQVKPRQVIPVSLGEGERPAVFVLKEQFGRVFRLAEDGSVEILHQFNATNRRARLSAACVGDFRGDGSTAFALYDRVNKQVTLFAADGTGSGDASGALATIDTGETTYSAMAATDLDGDGRDDLVLIATDRITLIPMRPASGSFQTVASAETPAEEGGYGLVQPLSLTRAGRQEIACVEMRNNSIEIHDLVTARGEGPELERVYSFRVFDSEASIARRVNMDAPPEPRELLAADMDGDGKADLVALVHDKVAIYHQRPR